MTAQPLLRSTNIVQRGCNLLIALAIVAVATYGVLRTRGATRMNVDRTVFTIVNTITLTGFAQPINPADMNWPGQLAIFALLCTSVVTWLTIGGWALVRVLRMQISDDEVMYGAVAMLGTCVIVGATVLIDRSKPIGPALFEAASALGNYGLALQRGGMAADWQRQVVIFPAALIGALGAPVVIDLLRSAWHARRPHTHSAVALSSMAGVYLLGAAAIAWIEISHGADTRQAWVMASGEAIDARTLGASSGVINSMARASQWVILLLMAIGACPAGTGGGIKSTTVYLLGRESMRLIAGKTATRMLGFAMAATGAWGAIALGAALVMMSFEPQLPFERIVFIAASATSNVGLSHEPLSVGSASMFALSAAMLLGRLVPLGLLCWAARKGVESDVAMG